ncbi:PREDICTED: uncharacterized protein LOC104821145 [Tarenaya hassleriana]|uniref:uncharacterized protein LOC104821145 n=1 Tax=Tarenaya hassleriana TaxID=28532 RepID=UPI00053C22F1|nr:PREDICTED: uncharacterized protein LOC104821145 [Tarenaya hassleriana]
MEGIIKAIQNQISQKDNQIKTIQENLSKLFEEREELIKSLNIIIKATGGTPVEEDQKQEQTTKGLDQVTLPTDIKVEEKPNKWYAIFSGPFRGVYVDYAIFSQHTNGKKVSHQTFQTKEEAQKALNESYKTMAQKQPAEPKAQLPSMKIPRIAQIPTTQEKEAMKKVTLEKYQSYWASLVDYKEKHTTMGFYPKMTRTGPKAIFIGEANPLLAFDYLQHGLVDSIYTDSMKIFEEFPRRMKPIIRNYFERFAKERTIFMKIKSSIPIFGKDKIIQSQAVIHLGVAKGDLPSRDDASEYEIPDDLEAHSLLEVFKASRRILADSEIKVNYASSNVLVITYNNSTISKEEMQAVADFELDFYHLEGKFAGLEESIKEQLCSFLMRYDDHKCTICKELKDKMKRSSQPPSEESADA